MINAQISNFVINSLTCNISQMYAYNLLRESFTQVFNLDVESALSVFTCTSPLQTIKGMLIGIIDLCYGADTSKTLSDDFHEDIYTMIEFSTTAYVNRNEKDAQRIAANVLRNALIKATYEVYPQRFTKDARIRPEEYPEEITELLKICDTIELQMQELGLKNIRKKL